MNWSFHLVFKVWGFTLVFQIAHEQSILFRKMWFIFLMENILNFTAMLHFCITKQEILIILEICNKMSLFSFIVLIIFKKVWRIVLFSFVKISSWEHLTYQLHFPIGTVIVITVSGIFYKQLQCIFHKNDQRSEWPKNGILYTKKYTM